MTDSTEPRWIRFNLASLAGREMEYVAEAVANGHLMGDGPFSRRCEQLLADLLGVPQVLLTTSCTASLEMAALLLDIQPGDEVIVPSFTFVSSANAFVLRGALPVFIDIRPDTLNLDETQLESLISPRTKAAVAMHYAGVGCEMDDILDIAGRHGVAVVEDNAHGLFGRYRGRYLGTLGAFGTQSFHETKNFTCGEGGALLINDERYIERAEVIREKGTNRRRFFRGEVDKYTWVDIGSSYLPSDILAAFLCAQLEQRVQIQERRRAVWAYYRDALSGWADSHGVRLPHVPAHCDQAYHAFYLILPSPEIQRQLLAYLHSQHILAVFHYLPLHLSEVGRRFGGRAGALPVTEDVSARLIRLPFYADLTAEDQSRVVHHVKTFFESR